MAGMGTPEGSRDRSPSARFLDVELVDDAGGSPHAGSAAPAALTASAASAASAAPSGRAVRVVRRWWWRVAVAVVVVLAVTSVVADRLDAARLARLAGVAGVVAPLGGPPHAEWSTTDGVWSTPIETAGRLVFATPRSDHGTDVVALDAGTGTEDWRAPLDPPAADTTASLTSSCVAVSATGATPRPLVACLAGLFLFNGSGGGTASVTTRSAHLELIDAASGAIVRDAPTAPTTAIGAIGTDLLRVDLATDGHLRVVRTDPLATTPRWTFTSPTAWRAVDGTVPAIDVEAGRIFVGGGRSGWVVLSSDGTLVRAGDPAVGSGRVAGFTGRSLFTESTSSAADAARTDVLDLSTGRSVTVAGDLAGPSPDDRSLPDLVLTWTRDSLVASDVTTGATRWSTPLRVNGQGSTFLRGGGQVMVVDEHVVVDDARSLRMIDGRSGAVVWEHRHATPIDRGAATDGTVVVAVTTESNSTATMTAYGVADGLPRWSVSVPPPTQQLTTLGRSLVVVTPGRITIWG